MEGERILQSMKDGGDFESLQNAIKAYLSPLHSLKKCSKEKSNKYGLFAMKLLHVCVKCWTDCKPNNGMLMNLVMICKSAYNSVLVAKNTMKTSPLALEKLLFHIMSQILKKGLILDGISFAESLYKQLLECHSEHLLGYTVDNDYDTLAKQSYNQLWKACVELDESKQNSVKHSLVLQIRQQALAFLLLSNMPLSDVVDWTLKTASEFERNTSKVNQTEKWTCLIKFFTESINVLTTNKHFTKGQDGMLKDLSSLFRLAIQTIKCCLYLSDSTTAKDTLELINKRLSQAIKLVGCNSYVFHTILDLLHSMVLFNTIIIDSKHQTEKLKLTVENETKINNLLQNFHTTVLKALEKCSLDVNLVENLVEVLDLLHKHMISTTFSDSKNIKPYQENFADVFLNVLISSLNVLEYHRQIIITAMDVNDKAGKSKHQIQKNINRQLSILNMLANILIFQLGERKNSRGDNGLTPEGIVNKVDMVLQKNVDLIEDVSSGGGGSLSTNEHRWLGCNAFNLGLLFYRREWYKYAVWPLNLACSQLTKWCTNGQHINKDKIQQIQLFTKFELLADCQRKAGLLKDATSSLESSMALMCTSEPLLRSTVELWVKCKRDSVKNGHEELQTRTVKDAVLGEELEGIINNHVTDLLHIELNIYKTQRYNTIVEQYAVVCDLLEIYSSEQYALKRSTMLIHLAKLLIRRDFDTEFSSEDCFREAISLLERLLNVTKIEDIDVKKQSAELVELSFAYFWLCVCEMESTITRIHESYKQKELIANKCKTNETKKQTSGHEEEKVSYCSSAIQPMSNLGLESNIMEPLNKAVDIWRQLVTEATLDVDAKHELHQCIEMAAAIYHLQDRPLQHIVTLLLASTIGSEDACSQNLLEVGSVLSKLGVSQLITKSIDKIPVDSIPPALAHQLLAKCRTLLHSGKVKEAIEILEKVNDMELLEKRNRHAYMIKSCVLHLLAELLNLPEELTNGTSLKHLCPDLPTSLDLHHDALKLRMSVARLVFGDEIYCSGQNGQTDIINPANERDDDGICKWSIIASVLDSLLYVGRQYTEQGCVRQARCYLSEGLSLAQKFMVPRRCAEYMLELTRVELLTGELVKVRSNLECSKAFLSMNKNNVALVQRNGSIAVKVANNNQSLSNSFSFDVSDEEDNFIQTRKLSMTTEQISNNTECMDSSPSLKVCRLTLPEYSKHPDSCSCSACLDIMLQKLDMDLLIIQARICGQEGDLVEEENILRSVKQFYNDVYSKSSMQFQLLCTFGEVIMQKSIICKQLKVKAKVSESIYRGLNSPLLHLYVNIFSCLVKQERFSLAKDYYDRCLEAFQTCNIFLSRDFNALSKLHFTSALCDLHQSAIENGCKPTDILNHSWNIKDHESKNENDSGDALADQFEDLSICCTSPSIKSDNARSNWVELVSTEVRPEVARHRKSVRVDSEKLNSCDLGIFSDLLDEPQKMEVMPMSTPAKKCTMTTKKGSVVYSVKQCKTAKSKNKQQSSLKNNDVFSFGSEEEECAKLKTSRKSRQKTKAAKGSNKTVVEDFIFCDNSPDNAVDLKETTAKSQRVKRAKSSKMSSDGDRVEIKNSSKTKQEILNGIFLEDTEEEQEIPTVKKTKGRKKTAKYDVESNQNIRKTTRARQKNLGNKEAKSEICRKKITEKAEELSDTDPYDQCKSVKKRGRKPKINISMEALRADSDSSEDVLMLSAISELSFEDEPIQTSPLADDIHKGTLLEDVPFVRSSLYLDFSNNREDDYTEVEMLRYGSESDGDDDDLQKFVKRKPKNEQQKKRTTEHGFIESDDVTNIKKTIKSVKDKVYQAYNLIKHNAPSPIFNQICLLLAVCHGDDDPDKSVFYLNTSMANTLRHQKLLCLGRQQRKLKKDNSKMEEINKLMAEKRIFLPDQHDSVLETVKQLPDGWTVVTMAAVCMNVEDAKSNLDDVNCLLMSRIVNGYEPLILRIPVHNDSDGNSLSETVAELQAIITENIESSKELDKKAWWINRQGLDQRMKTLVEDIEDKLLKCWKGIIIGQPKNKSIFSKLISAAKKLQQKISLNRKVSLQTCQILLQSTSSLSFQQLTSMLSSISGFERGTESLLACLELVRNITKTLKQELTETTHHPVILILDKHLQQLPWENISTAKSQAVCRIPSLDFLACHLHDRQQITSLLHQGVNADDTYYVLNPRNDLANTQLTFQNWFNKELAWNGVIGRIPDKEEYTSALTKHDLFVYCGHGSGGEFLNGDDIQKIKCRAVTLLMGCSSGRLKYSGSLEASGMALNYLVAGCPCIVANLWDVTDRDIDRFLVTLLKSWLAKSNNSSYITDYIYEARNACKLNALIGFSPVTYGLPVQLK